MKKLIPTLAVLLLGVLLLSACGGSTRTPTMPEVRKLDIKIIPSIKDVEYRVFSWCDDCPEPSLVPKNIASEGVQTGNIVIEFAPDNQPEIDINITGYYSLSFKPTESLSEIEVPFLKEAVTTRNGFINNSNGSITFPDTKIESFHDGKVKISGICEVFGDDYNFNSIFDVTKGMNIVQLTSTNANTFNNTAAECSIVTSLESVNSINPLFEF